MATRRAKPADATGRKFLRQPPTEFIHALARTKLPGDATRLMAYLYDRANPEKPMAFVTLKAAAEDMGISEWTVKRALDVLENADRIAVKVLPSGTRIVVVKPLPAPDRTPPETWAKQIERVWEELGGPPSSSATPPNNSAEGDEQNRQGRGAELPAPPVSSAHENAESPVPERGSADLITLTNHPPESHTLNHSPDGEGSDLSAVVRETAEACRDIKVWTWDAKARREQEAVVRQLLDAGHSSEDIVACVRANAGEIKASLRYLLPLLPRWKAARDLPPGTAPCWKCDVLVVMQRGDRLQGVQVGDKWQHTNCPTGKSLRRCFACGLPVDPVTSWARDDHEAVTAIAGYEVKFADGRIVVTHNEACGQRTLDASDDVYNAIEAKKADSP